MAKVKFLVTNGTIDLDGSAYGEGQVIFIDSDTAASLEASGVGKINGTGFDPKEKAKIDSLMEKATHEVIGPLPAILEGLGIENLTKLRTQIDVMFTAALDLATVQGRG